MCLVVNSEKEKGAKVKEKARFVKQGTFKELLTNASKLQELSIKLKSILISNDFVDDVYYLVQEKDISLRAYKLLDTQKIKTLEDIKKLSNKKAYKEILSNLKNELQIDKLQEKELKREALSEHSQMEEMLNEINNKIMGFKSYIEEFNSNRV